ncbi:MAG: hypothetical protein Q8Q60_05060 [Candidatus Chromulinivorax sp.]|nr:hypothetical protein [Candidatus Chromulinivorax sp.]
MNRLLSTINFIIFLFASIDLSCSELNDFQSPVDTMHAPRKRILPQINLQSQEKDTASQSIFTSPNAKFAADVATTAVKTIANIGYQGIKLAATATYEAYNNRNQHPSLGDAHTLKNDSDYESDSDSEEEFKVITAERKNRFYTSQNELQCELQDSPDKAIAKLNQAIKSYYLDEDPVHHKTQQALFHMYTLLQESGTNGNELTLQAVIANNYHDIQRNILIQAIQDHVTKIEPSIEEKYDITIKQATIDRDHKIDKANKKFDTEKRQADAMRKKQLTKYNNRLKHIAFSTACLNKSAIKSESHPAYDSKHFESIDTYKSFLSDMRQKYTDGCSSSQHNTVSTSLQIDIPICNSNEPESNVNKIIGKNKKNKNKNNTNLGSEDIA